MCGDRQVGLLRGEEAGKTNWRVTAANKMQLQGEVAKISE
jgi:hypothetical protein